MNSHRNSRRMSPADIVLDELNEALKVLAAKPRAERTSPAENCANTELTAHDKQLAAGLMRVNHSGEVCAQALYRGQALSAKNPDVQKEMARAAQEEVDHLAWCQQRLDALESRPSVLNPLWYVLSFSLGAAAGALSDRLSLGFVAATEEQVSEHLRSHLDKLPERDQQSHAVVEQMLDDEQAHGANALRSGGLHFPRPIKKAMAGIARLMTESSRRI